MKQIFYLKTIPSRKSLKFSIKKIISSVEVSQDNHIEQNISGENKTQSKQEVHIENSPQITKEIKETQNISQNHNESILNEPQSHKIENEKSIVTDNQKMFDKAIHKEDWIEEGENYIAPRHHKNNEGDKEL